MPMTDAPPSVPTPPPALPDFDLVLFGATGDLAMRKLLPGLYRRHVSGDMAPGARILGVARSALSREEFLAQAEESCRARVREEFDAAKWQGFVQRVSYLRIDATVSADYAALAALLAPRPAVVRVFFLSTAPGLFEVICRELQAAGVVTAKSRLVLEKPLGTDAESANHINDVVAAAFQESQIFRIDHYLGKETVQNLLALRFGNTLFEPLWRRDRVRHVQITVAEQLGVGTRADFYDRTGALRDMVQNHLLQLLCIIAMEPPVTATADAVRDEKLKVLRALRPMAGAEAVRNSVRGQYRAGVIGTQNVPAYGDEPGVGADSTTETYVALRVDIDSWRWAGVPFYLRTGKRMPDALAEIVLTFEQVPHSIFDGIPAAQPPNRLVIRLQPEEHITLRILAKRPGEAMRLKPVDLGLDLTDSFKSRRLDAYERLLGDAIQGNLTLFMRRDEVDAAWRWIDPIRAAWDADLDGPKPYAAGTWGPAAAASLIARDGFEWHDEL
jgi:glucose-6-phosphate 1-dehydrogenase